MKGYVATAAALALIASTLVAADPVARPAHAATATGDETAVGLAAGLGLVADWYADDLPTHDRFGEGLPLVSITPGEDVRMERVFADLVPFRSGADLGNLDDVADLATRITDSDVDPGDDSLSWAVDAEVVGSNGLEITVTIERALEDVGFSVLREAGDGVTPVDISSPPGGGVDLDLSFSSTMTVHYVPAQDQFWIDASPAPAVTITAAIDPNPFTVAAPGLPANVGILDVAVQPGSTLSLDLSLTATLADTDGDGILQFLEMPDDGTTNTVPGEMLFALEDLVGTIARAGSVDGDLALEPATVEIGDGPDAAQVTVSGADLTTDEPTVETDAAYDDVFADFLNISATDLLGGLGQLFMASSLIQGHPVADIRLPLLGLNLRQIANPANGLAEFVVEQSITEGDGFDPLDPEAGGDFGKARFDTIGEMVALMTDDATGISGLDDGVLVPTYEPDDQLLDLRINISNDLGGEQPVKDEQGNNIGWLDFGDLLQEDTGIRGLKQPRVVEDGPNQGNPLPSQLRARQGGTVDFHWTVDLQPAVPCGAPGAPEEQCEASDEATFEVTETPPVFERFGLRSSERPEITVLSKVRVPANGSTGTAGWVEVQGVGGEIVYQPEAGESEPALSVDLLIPDGHQSVHQFLLSLNPESDEDLTREELEQHVAGKVGLARALGLSGNVQLEVFDADGNQVEVEGSADAAGISVDWPDVLDENTTPTGTTDDERSTLLKELDYDPAHRTALFGRVADTVDGLLSQAEQFAGSEWTASIPLVGRSLESLFRETSSLSQTLDEVRTAGPPGSLQDFERMVQDELGSLLGGTDTAGWLSFDLQDLGNDDTPDVVFGLAPSSTYTDTLPISIPIDIPGVGNLFGGPEGTLNLEVDAGLSLGFPVEVSDTPLPAPNNLQVRQDSGFDVGATASSDELGVKIGGVDLQLGPGGEAKLGAGVEVGVAGATDSFVGAGVWATGLQAQLQTQTQTCTTTTIPNDSDHPDFALRTHEGEIACVNMPVLINGSPVDPDDPGDSLFQVSADDLADPSVDRIPPGLADALAAQVLDLIGLGDIMDQLNDLLALALDATQWGSKLPLIGEHLTGDDQALSDIQEALQDFVSALENPVAAAEAAAEGADEESSPPVPTVGDVRQALQDAAASLEDSALVLEFPGDDTVKITLFCGDPPTVCDPDDADSEELPATTVSGVEVEFSLGQDDSTGTPFDLGLDALPLRVDGNVGVDGGWSVDLGIGVSRDHGVYLLSNPRSSSDDGSADPPEIVAQANASVDGEAGATLGVFKVKVAATDDSGVDASFTANLPDKGEGKVTAGQLLQVLGSPGQLDPDFDIGAGIRLTLSAEAGVPGVDGLPGLEAGLCYQYPATDDCDSDAGLKDGAFDPADALVQFTGVDVDLGDALEELFGKPLGFVGDITEPIEPVLAFLTTPIPVISDLSRKFGGPNVTMLSLARALGLDESADFIEAIDVATGFVGGLTTGTIELADEVVLDPVRAAGNRAAPDQAFGALVDSVNGMIGEPDEDPGSAAIIEDNKDETDDTASITAPIFDDPGCLLRMAFGEDCDIVRWEPPALRVEFTYEQAFGPFFGVLYVTIGGFAGAQARLGLGMDTSGVREALDADSVVQGIEFVLNGLFVIDYDGPEVSLDAGLKAGGKVDVGIAAAGVDGGVAAELGFDLRDPVPDGRVHVSEVRQKILTPLCLFDIVGRLKAFLDVWARAGLGPFSVKKTFRLAEVILLDFASAISSTCDDESPPVLAETISGETWDFGPGRGAHSEPVLRLNMGEFTEQRGAFKSVVNENFAVRELESPVWDGDEPVSPGSYEVSAFGFTQEHHPKDETKVYEGYAVVFQAAGGDDQLAFTGGQSVDLSDPDVDLSALPTAAFSAPVWGDLGAGDDVIYAGEGSDRIAGGAGEDTIFLGGGDDRAHGDSSSGLSGVFSTSNANDVDGANDIIDGGDDDDRLWGGGGADEVNGGNGNDRLFGGDANDVLYGDDGTDRIVGGRQTDTIYGGDGADRVWGDFQADGNDPNATDNDDAPEGSARDVIFGGPGLDRVWAGGGNDEAFGAEGNDIVFGQWGNDTIEGNEGHDRLAGGPGRDTIDGRDGNDRIWGDARPDDGDNSSLTPDDSLAGGNDTLRGGDGSDFIDGGGRRDTIHGGAGADALVGGWNRDTIRGDADGDLIAGDVTEVSGSPNNWSMTVDPDDGFAVGPCDLEIFGTCFSIQSAADTIFGGADEDTIHGQSGGDEIHAGLGNDLVFGNAGTDEIWGDGGQDELHGNTGNDELMAGPGDDLAFGGPGTDELYGHAGNDRLIGGSADADAADDLDTLYGGADHDVLLGDNGTVGDPGVDGETVFDESKILPVNGQDDDSTYGNDHLNGGSGRDVLHGQDGNDTLLGGSDDDQLFGELGEDWLEGAPDHDALLGDRGTVTPAAAVDPDDAAGPGRWPGGAPIWTVELVEPDAGAVDHLFGQSGNDQMFGGWDNDHMEGGSGDDHMEGNGDRDTMYGNAPESGSLAGPLSAAEALLAALDPSDADDMIGGSSDVNPEEAKLDDGEFLMFGNEDEDVMAGDNANIVGVVDPDDATQWAVDDVTGGRLRDIELLDREKTEDTPILLSEVSGGDLMHGNEGNDRIHGQGGTDILRGNEGDDFVQGSQNRDLIEGGEGDDDLIGGSEFLSPFAGTDGQPADLGDFDDGDEIYGGAGNDVILGDNGIVTRVCEDGVDYNYVTTQLGIGAQRCITFLDLEELSPGHFGRDVLSGGAGVDVLFGQDDDDIVAGGPDDDYMEGNGADDWLFGDSLASDVKADPPTVTLPYEELPQDVQDDLALPTPGTLEFPPTVPFFDTCPLEDPGDDNDCRSPKLELEGPEGPDGQDDQVGGSSQPDFRDGDDVIFGDGAADFQLGDNGVLNRTIEDGAYRTYVDYNPTTVVRDAIRFDVNGPPHTHGDDVLIGADGDDYQYGQDGNDALLGQDGNDEQYGELGDDWIDGARGQDVQIGDRGSVVSRLLGPGEEVTHTTGGPAFFDIRFMREDTLDRRVDLLHDVDGTPLEFPGLTHGGNDIMLGGPGHDVMHGAFGDDAMNGNSGGDWMYGADGTDVMWGGHGCVPGDPEDGVNDDGTPCDGVEDPGVDDQFVDILFGGHSGDTADTADILDFRPRPDDDPLLWHLLTGTLDDDEDDPTTLEDNDHHHGVDWIYGGWGRDVLQGDIGQNGPEPDGDRLIDWIGAYNLYTRCNASYGDDGDIRQRSPQMETLLELLAFATGVGETEDDVRDPTTSAYRELALVYKPDTKDNNGKAFPNTPGHFDEPSCLP